jgi:hypothetical protein
MSFSQYKETLIAAATRRDERLKPGASTRAKRVVQNMNSSYGGATTEWFEDGYLDDGMNYFDMGNIKPALVHLAFQRGTTNRNNNQESNRLPREIWDKLGPELQAEVRKWNKTKAFKHKGNQQSREINLHEIDDRGDDIDLEGIDIDGRLTDNITNNECKHDEIGEESNLFLAHITKQRATTSPHNIRNILTLAHKRSETNNHFQGNMQGKSDGKPKSSVFIDGKWYVQADNHRLHYNIATHENRITRISSLVDRGANGGLAGEDVRIIEQSNRTANVSGINNHTIHGLPIVTAAGVVSTHLGPICLLMHQYANHGKGKTIHSRLQIENHGNDVNDKSLKVKGGKQCITTLDGYVIPLQIRGGLAYMDMHPPSDEELNDLPHVVLTSDADWDPTIVDNEMEIKEWLDAP